MRLNNHYWTKLPMAATTIISSLFLASCGWDLDSPSGFGSGGQGDFFVYDAKQGGSSADELYMVDYANLGSSTKINGPLVPGGNVTRVYQISDDGTKVVYEADQDKVGVIELYVVDTANPGVSTKLNGDLGADGDITQFRLTADGTKVLYAADQDTDDKEELYIVDLAYPGVSEKVNAPLIPLEGDVIRFEVTADSSQVVYLADQEVDSTFDLYIVDLTNLTVASKLSDAASSGDVRQDFELSPDGTKAVYVAGELSGSLTRELYKADLANPGSIAKLNDTLISNGNVGNFKISPDGTQVIYRADQDINEIFEIYMVSLTNPSTSTKLNDDVGLLGDVFTDFQITADGTQVFYRADQDTVNTDELYKVDVAKPGVSVKVNDALVTGGSVGAFEINLDGTQVVYRADQDTNNTNELYKVDLTTATPSMSTKVSASLNPFTRILGKFRLSADGLRVAYEADEDTDSIYELYTVDLANPGIATKVNDGPLSGFGLKTWKLWP